MRSAALPKTVCTMTLARAVKRNSKEEFLWAVPVLTRDNLVAHASFPTASDASMWVYRTSE